MKIAYSTTRDELTGTWVLVIAGCRYPDTFYHRHNARAMGRVLKKSRDALGIVGFCAAMALAVSFHERFGRNP